jgi:hypothetical protein
MIQPSQEALNYASASMRESRLRCFNDREYALARRLIALAYDAGKAQAEPTLYEEGYRDGERGRRLS